VQLIEKLNNEMDRQENILKKIEANRHGDVKGNVSIRTLMRGTKSMRSDECILDNSDHWQAFGIKNEEFVQYVRNLSHKEAVSMYTFERDVVNEKRNKLCV